MASLQKLQKNELFKGWGKNYYKLKQKKEKGRKKVKEKGRKKGKKGKEKKEKGKGKRKKGKEKEGRDVFLLTQDNKPNLFGEKKHIFSPGGKNIIYF